MNQLSDLQVWRPEGSDADEPLPRSQRGNPGGDQHLQSDPVRNRDQGECVQPDPLRKWGREDDLEEEKTKKRNHLLLTLKNNFILFLIIL